MILIGGVPGVIQFGPYGITPAAIAAGGDEDSPLLNDVDAGDTATELLWTLLEPLVASGTTEVDDDGGYALIAPADGVHAQFYRLLALPASGAAYAGVSVITTIVEPTTPPTYDAAPRRIELGGSAVGAYIGAYLKAARST